MTVFAQAGSARSSLIWLSLSTLVAFQLLAAGWVLCLAPGGHVRTESPLAPCPEAGADCCDIPLSAIDVVARADGALPSLVPTLAVLPVSVSFDAPDDPSPVPVGPDQNPAPPPPARLAPVLLI